MRCVSILWSGRREESVVAYEQTQAHVYAYPVIRQFSRAERRKVNTNERLEHVRL
jgi:hypothetical protein